MKKELTYSAPMLVADPKTGKLRVAFVRRKV